MYQALLSTAVIDLPRSRARQSCKGASLSHNNETQRLANYLPSSPVRVFSGKHPLTNQSCVRDTLALSHAPGQTLFRNPTASLTQSAGGGQRGFGGNPNGGETDWACSSSGGTTSSTAGYHDGFSEVFALPTAGCLGFGIARRSSESARPTEVSGHAPVV